MGFKNKISMCIIIGFFVSSIVLGCRERETLPRSETTGFITVTDLAGRNVKIKRPVERVVIANAGEMHEFISVEGGRNPFKKIVGWALNLKNNDRDTYDKYIKKFLEIENIPDVGYLSRGTFNFEKVIALKPDVVMFPLYIARYTPTDTEDAINKLNKAGIPVVFTDYWESPLEKTTLSILLLGKILGKEKRAQDIVDFYDNQVKKVYSRLKEIKKPKPTVYIEGGSKGPSEYGSTYGNVGSGVFVKIAGGINITENLIKITGPVNPEYLLKINPDIIIITGGCWSWSEKPGSMKLGYYSNHDSSRKLLEAFLNRPGWNTLNAVKNREVYSFYAQFTWRIYNFVVVQALAKWFYPDEFKDLDPEKSLKEYHKRFLPVDYSGVWMLSIKEQE